MEAKVSALLQIRNLNTYYGLIQALCDISLDVETGEIVAVIGANGAGKTTLLRAISGVVPSSRGMISFAGTRIDKLPPEQIVRLGLSHVPERRELFDSLTVLENLQLGAYHRRGREAKTDVQRDLEQVWRIFPILRARQKQMAGTLSGGEQQMLAIARGLMARPKLLLIDEPSMGLAPLLVTEVLRIITLLREMGQTVLLVEQNARGALEVANRAYLMEVGRIILHGSAQELMRDDRVRRAYLGKRVAHSRQPVEKASLPGDQIGVHKRIKDTRLMVRKGDQEKEMKAMKMLSETLPGYTLPDTYFEQRVGYTIEEIETIQDEALPRAFSYAFENSPFHQIKFSEAGLTPDSIRGLDDLTKIPFTNSEEIRPSPTSELNSQNLMAVRGEQVSLVHTSSGTTGAPKIFAYTGGDIARWAANTATVFWINGFRKSDVVLSVICPYHSEPGSRIK
jgi:branched-chain amino acid transport system ATP-binding protein